MKTQIQQIINKPFIRNVTVLASGTAVAQAIALISSPIITRLYGPDAYGIMGVFMAIAQIFIPVAALTYPIAIVLPKDDRNAKGLIRLSLYIAFGLATFVALILAFFNKPIVHLFQIQEVSSYLFLIPLVILFAGLMQVSNQWLIRTKQFGINAKVEFLQSFVMNGSKIGIGLFNPIAAVLVILSALGNGLKAVMMMIFAFKSDYRQQIEQQETQRTPKELAKKHKDFPMYRAPETLINEISQRLPVLMLTTFFGPASAGFYTIGNTVLQKPIQLIGKSVGNVFYPRISEAANNKENLSKLIKKATLAMGAVGLVPFGIIIVFGPWLFSVIFGGDWITAGKYAQWIGVYLFFEFINKPSVRTLPVLSAQLFLLKVTTVMLLVRIAALAMGYYIFSSDLVAIAFFGVSSAIVNILLILLTLRKSQMFDGFTKNVEENASQ